MRYRRAERGHHDEAVRGKLIDDHRVRPAPFVGSGVDDAQRGILLGVIGMTVGPDQDRVAVSVRREIFWPVHVETLLGIPIDGIGGVAREGPDVLVGCNRERSRHRRIGGCPSLANTRACTAAAARACSRDTRAATSLST